MQYKDRPLTVHNVRSHAGDLVKDNIAYRDLDNITGLPDELNTCKRTTKQCCGNWAISKCS